jgi:hypothetical protein
MREGRKNHEPWKTLQTLGVLDLPICGTYLQQVLCETTRLRLYGCSRLHARIKETNPNLTDCSSS